MTLEYQYQPWREPGEQHALIASGSDRVYAMGLFSKKKYCTKCIRQISSLINEESNLRMTAYWVPDEASLARTLAEAQAAEDEEGEEP